LWDDGEPPYEKPHSNKEYQDDNCWGNVPCIHQVVTPTLTLYLPEEEPNGTVVVILPGGLGFGPGRDEGGTAQWLSLAANWLDRLGAVR